MLPRTKLFPAWVAKQQWSRQHAEGPRLWCCLMVVGSRYDNDKCDSSHKQGYFQLGLLSNSGVGCMQRVLSFVAVYWVEVTSLLY